MENVVLTVHLVLALLLIGVVLLQRSEGGGLGMGGGGGGVMTGRQAANALTKATWIIAAAFLVTSIALTVIAARNSVGASVVDRIAPMGTPAPATGLPNLPAYTPPPAAGQPVLPPGAASAPVTAPAEGPVTPPEPAASVPADAPAAAETAAPSGSAGNVTTQTVPIAPAPAN